MTVIINLLGMAIMLGLMFLCSHNRKAINWRLIGIALVCQIIVSIIFVKIPAGIWVIEQISQAVIAVFNYGKEGLTFVFGPLIDPTNFGFIFFFQVLLPLIFIGALVNVLAYIGVLGGIISVIGAALGKIIGTTRVESFITIANMFLGQTDSPLLIAKYLRMLTTSELFVVLTAGMCSMSVSVLGGYHALGINMDILIIACTMVPFGSIAFAKMLYPEEETVTQQRTLNIERRQCGVNLLEALTNGAMDGGRLVLSLSVSLVAIVALVALINGCCEPLGFTLQMLLGWIMYPVAFLLGVGEEFTELASQLLGTKLVLNEFVALSDLAPQLPNMDERTQAVLSLAMASFANIGSMVVCVAALGALAPEKKSLIATIIPRALLGAFCLNLFNAMLISILYTIGM